MPPRKYRSGSIAKIKNDRSTTFEAYTYVDHKRKRKRFKTEGQARAWIDAHEPLHQSQLLSLDAHQMMDASKAISLLPEGFTLTEAVKFFIENHAGLAPLPIDQAVEKFLEAKAAAGLRTKSLQSYRYPLGKLKDLGKLTHEITTEDLEKTFLPEYSHTTIGSLRKNYLVFFNWAIRRGYAKVNPAANLEAQAKDQALPKTFDNAQCAALLYASMEIAPETLAEFAIGIFAGIRPTELQRLTWGSIRADAIHIGPEVAKKRRQRFVGMSANLKAWLDKAPAAKKDDRICKGMKFQREQKKQMIRRLAGINDWPQDVLRHTFASNHLAHHRDAAATSLELGHRSQDVLFDHYRNIIERDEAAAFWALTPENCSDYFPRKIFDRIQKAKKTLSEKTGKR